jgi:predicted amidohydrolase
MRKVGACMVGLVAFQVVLSASAQRVRIAVVSLINDPQRSVREVVAAVDEAGREGADLVLLPQECVPGEGEEVPGGPTYQALAAKAREWDMYIVGNLKERVAQPGPEQGKVYLTSFILGRAGELVGKYRKTHKLPDETGFALGDDLPVFKLDFGTVGLKIGTDHLFPEVDGVLCYKGANLLLWSTAPWPVEDLHTQAFLMNCRAVDFAVYQAVARYARKEPGWITNNYEGGIFGCELGRAYVCNPDGDGLADTGLTGGGVAIASIPADQLRAAGRRPSEKNEAGIFKLLAEPVKPPELPKFSKRRIRIAVQQGHPSPEGLLAALDEAGQAGADLVCCYEFVWRDPQVAKPVLAGIAERCRKYNMNVVIGGVLGNVERNEGLVFNRQGEIVGRYYKIYKTHEEQIVGTETPVFDLDFARIGIRICADEWAWEIDRCYFVQGAELMVTPTQSWGPYARYREMREMGRCIDNVMYLVSSCFSDSETDHRSFIVDPCGVIVARSQYWDNGLFCCDINLDNKPRRFIREYTRYERKGYLPEFMSGLRPAMANDYAQVLRACRRPELYGIIARGRP